MDNLQAHIETEEDQGADRAAGLRTALSLPSYSAPTTTPYEEVFAKAFAEIKNLLLGKAAARSKEALVEAIGAALSAVTTAADAQGFFEHAGYRPLGQLL